MQRLTMIGSVVRCSAGAVSEHQHEQADHHQQTDQENDANCAAQKLQHEDDSCCSGYLKSDWGGR